MSLELIEKALRSLPENIREKLFSWARLVERSGIREVRKIPGYHDEQLKGNRYGQRSVRLSKSYRGIYCEEQSGIITIIKVQEVHKHDY